MTLRKRRGLLAGENSKVTFDEACEDYFQNRMQKDARKKLEPGVLWSGSRYTVISVHDYLST